MLVQLRVHLGLGRLDEVEQLRAPLIGHAGRAGEPGQVPRARGVELYVATVAAAVVARSPHPDRRRWLEPGLVAVGTAVADQGEHRVIQRHLDDLAPARPLPGDQRHHDRGRAEIATEARGQRQGRVGRTRPVPTRRLLAGARDRVRGGGLQHAFPAPYSGAGIVLRETGQRAVDQPRIDRPHRLCAQAQTVHHPGTEVLDHDIGGLDQPPRGREPLVGLQIEDDAALVAVQERVGHPVIDRSTGRVDMNHVSTLISEHHRGQWPRDVVPEVDYPKASERTAHVSPPHPRLTPGSAELPNDVCLRIVDQLVRLHEGKPLTIF